MGSPTARMEAELAGLLATELLHLCLAAACPEPVVNSVEVLLVVQAWNPELRALFSKQGVACFEAGKSSKAAAAVAVNLDISWSRRSRVAIPQARCLASAAPRGGCPA